MFGKIVFFLHVEDVFRVCHFSVRTVSLTEVQVGVACLGCGRVESGEG